LSIWHCWWNMRGNLAMRFSLVRLPAVLLLALVTASRGGPPAVVTVSGAAAAPGETAILALTFSAGAEAASGIQFDLKYDASLIGLQVKAGQAAQAAGKNMFASDIDSNTKRLLFVGADARLLPEGALADISATVTNGAAPGIYTLEVTNVIATTPDGQQAFASSVGGSLTVPAQGEGRTKIVLRPARQEGRVRGVLRTPPRGPVNFIMH